MNELSEKAFKNVSSKDAKAFGTAIMEVVNRMKEQPTGKVTVGCIKVKVDEPTNGILDVGAGGASHGTPLTTAQHPQLATTTGAMSSPGPSKPTINLIPKGPIVNSLFDYMGESNSDDEGPIGGKGYIGRLAQDDQKIVVNMLRRIPPQQFHENVADYEHDYEDRQADGESILRRLNVNEVFQIFAPGHVVGHMSNVHKVYTMFPFDALSIHVLLYRLEGKRPIGLVRQSVTSEARGEFIKFSDFYFDSPERRARDYNDRGVLSFFEAPQC